MFTWDFYSIKLEILNSLLIYCNCVQIYIIIILKYIVSIYVYLPHEWYALVDHCITYQWLYTATESKSINISHIQVYERGFRSAVSLLYKTHGLTVTGWKYVCEVGNFQWKYMRASGWEWLGEQVRNTEYEHEIMGDSVYASSSEWKWVVE